MVYGQLPLNFEANLGQVDAQVKFVTRGRGYTLFLTATEALLALPEQKPEDGVSAWLTPKSKIENPESVVLRMKLIGANPAPQIAGMDQLPGKSNYFIGNDPKKWHTNIPHYARVRCKDVYPGVDLVYYGKERQLEYDFVVAPGADPRLIKLAFEGAQHMHIDEGGDLVLQITGGEIRMRKPVVYQELAGLKQPVPGRYVLNVLNLKSKTQNQKSHLVGFQIASYDASRPLVIDPVLAYSTYLGGSGGDVSNSIAVDSEGNVYVTGQTDSPDFPLANAFQPSISGNNNAFVAKLDSTGTMLLYSTYLGGSRSDRGNSIAVDPTGNAYVTGRVSSDDFPTTPDALLTSFRGGMFDAFVAKLNAEGNALIYSTYLGGFANDDGFGIAVDQEGNAYVTGGTRSDDFPITENAFQPVIGGALDTFVAKLDSAGTGLIYSTYLGGSFVDRGNSIAVDQLGNAYVTGWTESPDFPTANAFQPDKGGGRDAFVMKLNGEGSAVVYSTFLGGDSSDIGIGIAVDSAGNAYVTGETRSSDFPTVNALQESLGGGRDTFIAMTSDTTGGPTTLIVSPATAVPIDTVTTTTPTATHSIGLYPLYAQDTDSFQFIGGGDDDVGGTIAVDTNSSVYVSEQIRPDDFQTANAPQDTDDFQLAGPEALDAFDGGQGDAVEVVFHEEAPDLLLMGFESETVWDLAGRAMQPLPFSLDDSAFIGDSDLVPKNENGVITSFFDDS